MTYLITLICVDLLTFRLPKEPLLSLPDIEDAFLLKLGGRLCSQSDEFLLVKTHCYSG